MNAPAFPVHPRVQLGDQYQGMTTRAYFAAAAVTGIMASKYLTDHAPGGTPENIALCAYAVADAMIAEEEKRLTQHIPQEETIPDATVETVDFMAILADHKNWELDYGDIENDPIRSDRGWRVHVRGGNTNDREWTLIGHGDTPAKAIMMAVHFSEKESAA